MFAVIFSIIAAEKVMMVMGVAVFVVTVAVGVATLQHDIALGALVLLSKLHEMLDHHKRASSESAHLVIHKGIV
jgi:hypothetical protein